MEFTLTTPALLFSAISLLLLAYTNRFLAIASLIRSMKTQYLQSKDENLLRQIANLRRRIYLIRNMQACGIISFFFCVFCMFLMYYQLPLFAQYVFGLSLFLLMISLYISFREIQLSVNALKMELSGLKEEIDEAEKGIRKFLKKNSEQH
jgi:Mg2+/Co2+ transporter CorB